MIAAAKKGLSELTTELIKADADINAKNKVRARRARDVDTLWSYLLICN